MPLKNSWSALSRGGLGRRITDMSRKKSLDFLEQLNPCGGILKIVVVTFERDELDLLSGVFQSVLLDLALLDREGAVIESNRSWTATLGERSVWSSLLSPHRAPMPTG